LGWKGVVLMKESRTVRVMEVWSQQELRVATISRSQNSEASSRPIVTRQRRKLNRFPLKQQDDCQPRLRTERKRFELSQQSWLKSFQEEA